MKLTSDFRNQLNLHQPLLALQLKLAEINLLILAILYLTLKLPFDNMDERSILEGKKQKPYLLFTLLFELIQQTVTFERKKIVKAHKVEGSSLKVLLGARIHYCQKTPIANDSIIYTN